MRSLSPATCGMPLRPKSSRPGIIITPGAAGLQRLPSLSCCRVVPCCYGKTMTTALPPTAPSPLLRLNNTPSPQRWNKLCPHHPRCPHHPQRSQSHQPLQSQCLLRSHQPLQPQRLLRSHQPQCLLRPHHPQIPLLPSWQTMAQRLPFLQRVGALASSRRISFPLHPRL